MNLGDLNTKSARRLADELMSNIPTEPGFYWQRDIDDSCGEAFRWKVVEVERRDNLDGHGERLYVVGSIVRPKEWKGEWGPRIPDPDETRELDEAVKRSIQNAHDFTRDKLAEQFLVGILANSQKLGAEDGVTLRTDLAYRYADAMIAERKKRNA